MSAGEFDLIENYFAPLASKGPPAFGLQDDAAVFHPPTGQDMVFTKDALVAGVHFLESDPPELVAKKALRVNLSDLASMGAQPLGYLLAIALPKSFDADHRESWVRQFTSGLGEDQKEYGLSLFGGDTVSTPGPLTISLTAIGAVDKGRALHRFGAHDGDHVFVSGSLGDAALGLAILQGVLQEENPDVRRFLTERYHLPRPRLALGQKLRCIASAAMDISDGLMADLAHLCDASGVGAQIFDFNLPVSGAAGKVLERLPNYKSRVWSGGDDYELLFTVPAKNVATIARLSEELGLALTEIGQITADRHIRLLDENWHSVEGAGEKSGYRHF
ncbi:thiamine-phosphate kinase [Emcibacter nanhaiensis]|uniref:Thiamine-monophosphate kinase n=1 Tax=Emcibacter nanhaiensis TaxID=1505037 RepID=A0A501PSF2_9PROT|nr:thiamine-phosphate kinase [Emcibacter nanhaiensis]TPD62716.1 thiamine-phosphate kinase [Emcibacter nanhaiensis]